VATGSLRILQVHNRYRENGGEDAVAAAETELLRASGHTVIEHHVRNPDGGVAAAATLLTAPWSPASAHAVRAAVRVHRPDIAHVHNTWFTLSPSVLDALHRSGLPVVMTVHNYRLVCVNALLFRDGRPCRDCVNRSPLPGVRHRCYRRSAISSCMAAATLSYNRARGTWVNAVDEFIAPSRELRDTLIESGLPADRVVMRPHAVPDVGTRPRAPSTSTTVLYAGRISDEKGLAVLLDAWNRARPRGLELVIAGDGPRRRDLERRGTEGVRFKGWLPREAVRELMLTARALMFPSLCVEVFPSTIVTAMAAGLPVVASAHGGPAEIVGALGNEWLAAPGDVDAWVERLAGLAEDWAVDETGARSREIYLSKYAAGPGVASLVDVYDAAIERACGR
jgi:glycosyltransferase involved in cell wall biosynthesis